MKRTFWAGVGYTLGLSTSIYVQRRVRRTVDRYAPEQIRNDVTAKTREAANRARSVAIELREAAQEGVAAMRREQRELREEFTSDPYVDPGPDPHRHRPTRLHH